MNLNSREDLSLHESNMEIASVCAIDDSNEAFNCNDEEPRPEEFETLEPGDSSNNFYTGCSESDDKIPPNPIDKTMVKAVLKALQITENTKA